MTSSEDEDSNFASGNHSDVAFQSIFFIENFYIDLSQFHNLQEPSVQHGWIELGASKQVTGTAITDDLDVETFYILY